jgi:hypothetical protein
MALPAEAREVNGLATKSGDYARLVARLIGGMTQQLARIEALKTKVDQL